MPLVVACLALVALTALLLPHRGERAARPRAALFLALLLSLVALAAVRSALATRLDGFTVDEPYHVASGVSYVRTGDFRLNPEHPPLVKLWVGAAFPRSGFALPAFRPLRDKPDERRFTQTAVFVDNDPDRVQQRARWAMLALSGLLLVLFGLAVRRAVGPGVALGAVAFLAIDPTIAAHAPVVMTDLPIALLAGTAVLTALVAFRSWRRPDLAAAGLALGLALGAKHSGLVVALVVALLGAGLALRRRQAEGVPRTTPRLALVALVLVSGWAVLWGLYGFRFAESPAGRDLFNRTLAEKLGDLRTETYRDGMQAAERLHLLPRAYLWGLADVLRAGVEGRGIGFFAFGRWYRIGAPWYFFPGVFLVRLPLGLTLLALLGAGLLARRRWRQEAGAAVGATGALALLFLLFLGVGSAYAGIRHAMAVFPALAVLGGLALAAVASERSRALRAAVAVGLLGALAAALPVIRPWEYYNELVGGPANAYRYFADEGVDLGQRTRELAAYYHREVRPRGEVPFVDYWTAEEELAARGVLALLWDSPETAVSDVLSGTVFVSASNLAPYPRFDLAALRRARPVARFGNLLVYRGRFHIPWRRSMSLYDQATEALISEYDPRRAERLLAEAVRLYPRHYVAAVELGNLRAKRGDRGGALAAYGLALRHTTSGDPLVEQLAEQIQLLGSAARPETLSPVRNPWAE